MIRDSFVVLGAVFVFLAIVIYGPLLVIWALNTLFPVLAIEYNFYTWCSVLILGALISPTIRVKNK